MTVISLKLPDGLAAQLADQARPSQLSQSDLVADLVGCCDRCAGRSLLESRLSRRFW